MADDTVGSAALTRELQLLRSRQRGDILRVTASFRCPSEGCPVGLVRIGVVEERGKRPFQWPARCSRCSAKMLYIGIELSR